MSFTNNNLFVYGTLMRTFGNNVYLFSATFVGKGVTENKYSLHVAYGIPFMHDNERLYDVHGEVYQVDDTVLAEVDELEDEGEWYIRKQIPVRCGEQVLDCWAYICNSEEGLCLGTGKFMGQGCAAV